MFDNEKTKSIAWYRSPVEPAVLKKLYERSDAKAFAQTLGYLGVIVSTATIAIYSAYHWPWWLTLILLFLHGTCYAFMINAVHELGHDTVFKSKRLNVAFTHLFAFLGYVNHRMFEASHVRHHRSTLHPPDDLEVVVPIKATLRGFLRSGFVNIHGPLWVYKFHRRVARGEFCGEWELKLFPESNPERRAAASRWARTILIGHGLILSVSILCHWWMIPVVVTFAPFYGGLLQALCNETQHIGLQDNVTDFRLCCRTFLPNPVLRFLYWHMNYHTEHHMYVGVPCYNLGKLHALIAHDLPPTPAGLIATWREINKILKEQSLDPSYRHTVDIPAAEVEVTS